MKKYLPVLIAMGSSLMQGADEPKQRAESVHTERIDFPSGGTLRLKNAIGVLTVEAWGRPEVEITTIKSSKAEFGAPGREKALRELEKVVVATEQRGDELVVTTEFPWFRAFPLPYPTKAETGFRLQYHIKAPATARIVDQHHHVGEVNIDGLIGDIDVTLHQREIMLHLPEDGRYSIQAKSDFGSVNSDFSEPEKRGWWLIGHRSTKNESAAPHKLNLRVGFGDIILLKTRIPKVPAALSSAPKGEGL